MKVGDLVKYIACDSRSPQLVGLVMGRPKKIGLCTYVPVRWFYNNHSRDYDINYIEVISEGS